MVARYPVVPITPVPRQLRPAWPACQPIPRVQNPSGWVDVRDRTTRGEAPAHHPAVGIIKSRDDPCSAVQGRPEHRGTGGRVDRPAADRPNVVIIVSDDQGYGDLSCMGATDFRTPAPRRACARRARASRASASTRRSARPSRASLLTGRYPGNAGVRNILMAHRDTPGLAPDVPTLAEALRSRATTPASSASGTSASAEGSRPSDRGFDESFGHLGGAFDFYSHLIWGAANREVVHNGRKGIGFLCTTSGRTARRSGATASTRPRCSASERSSSSARPPAATSRSSSISRSTRPTTRCTPPTSTRSASRDLPWDRQIMAAMISAMDDQIGDVMDELERQGVRENTIVLFLSDNGPSRQSRNWLDGSLDWYYGGSSGQADGPQVQPLRRRHPRPRHRQLAGARTRRPGARRARARHGRLPDGAARRRRRPVAVRARRLGPDGRC